MNDITTRHIRHDWPEWVDWDNQKTVKTMCGVRSRPGLCGIPGITEQSAVVEKNGRMVWGWCMRCVSITFPYYLPPELDLTVTGPEIIGLHEKARDAIKKQYAAHLKRKLLTLVRQGGQPGAEGLLRKQIDELTAPASS